RRGAEFDSRLVRTFDDLRANIEAGAEQVVDVRSRERYLGAGNGPDKRPGHIPGAVSLPFAECLEKGANVFRPLGELAEKGKGAGIDPDKPLVAYCGGGGSSPVVALGYYLLGKRDVAIYDGAWHDWCRHGEAPIERGAPESP
ncbi:MAG: sulfurtransferase, partial [Hyphomicrobiales bacterium]|nr:sulfurtransferase [Hyphomicrobiales bacterium]